MENSQDIIITNGSGTSNVLNGTYSVTANVVGYSNTSINPSSLTIVEGTDSYELTISAEGTLTLHVTETGETTGTSVVGAKFIRCDSAGNTYDDEVVSDSSGNAVFANVPYAESSAPEVYYKQTASDGSHNFDNSLKSITLDTETKTVEVANPLPVQKTFVLKDATYGALPINGSISLS